MKSYLIDINTNFTFDCDNSKFYNDNLTLTDYNNLFYKKIINIPKSINQIKKSNKNNKNVYDISITNNTIDIYFIELIENYKAVIYKGYNTIYKNICDNIDVIIYIFLGLLPRINEIQMYRDMTIFIINNTSDYDLNMILFNSLKYFNKDIIKLMYNYRPNVLMELMTQVCDLSKQQIQYIDLITMLISVEECIRNSILYILAIQCKEKNNLVYNLLLSRDMLYFVLYDLIYDKLSLIKIDNKNHVSTILINYKHIHSIYNLNKLYLDFKNETIYYWDNSNCVSDKLNSVSITSLDTSTNNIYYFNNPRKQIKYDLFYYIVEHCSKKYNIDDLDFNTIIHNLDYYLLIIFVTTFTYFSFSKLIKEDIDLDYHKLNDVKLLLKYRFYKKNEQLKNAINIINNMNLDDNWELKIKLIDNIISKFSSFNKRCNILNIVVTQCCIKQDLKLLNYLLSNYTINELGNVFFYNSVKNCFDNNNPLVRSALYLSNWHF